MQNLQFPFLENVYIDYWKTFLSIKDSLKLVTFMDNWIDVYKPIIMDMYRLTDFDAHVLIQMDLDNIYEINSYKFE